MPSIYISATTKELVKQRASFYCEYCYAPANFSPSYFEFDHIFPCSLGGNSAANNLAYACGICNNSKSNLIQYPDPFTNQQTNLFHPRTDLWTDHFQWNKDGTLILGVTSSGRATTILLQVNRPSNVNLRKLLFLHDLHPPKKYPAE